MYRLARFLGLVNEERFVSKVRQWWKVSCIMLLQRWSGITHLKDNFTTYFVLMFWKPRKSYYILRGANGKCELPSRHSFKTRTTPSNNWTNYKGKGNETRAISNFFRKPIINDFLGWLTGYLNDRDASQQTIDGEGWLHTGDLGYYDQDEHFFIVDKLKDLIKFRGDQVGFLNSCQSGNIVKYV